MDTNGDTRMLLLKDLCSRLPYGVKAQVIGWDEEKGEVELALRVYSINTDGYVYFEPNDFDVDYLSVEDCLLYLRPMSSMTEEELVEYKLLEKQCEVLPTFAYISVSKCIIFDWLNAHHLDYRGLIGKGRALVAPEGMYKEELK